MCASFVRTIEGDVVGLQFDQRGSIAVIDVYPRHVTTIVTLPGLCTCRPTVISSHSDQQEKADDSRPCQNVTTRRPYLGVRPATPYVAAGSAYSAKRGWWNILDGWLGSPPPSTMPGADLASGDHSEQCHLRPAVNQSRDN